MPQNYERIILDTGDTPHLEKVIGSLGGLQKSIKEGQFNGGYYRAWVDKIQDIIDYIDSSNRRPRDYTMYGYTGLDYALNLPLVVNEIEWLSDSGFFQPALDTDYSIPLNNPELDFRIKRAHLVADIRSNPLFPPLNGNQIKRLVLPYSGEIEFISNHILGVDTKNEEGLVSRFEDKLQANFADSSIGYPLSAMKLASMALGGAIISHFKRGRTEEMGRVGELAPRLPAMLAKFRPDYYDVCSAKLKESPLAFSFPPRAMTEK